MADTISGSVPAPSIDLEGSVTARATEIVAQLTDVAPTMRDIGEALGIDVDLVGPFMVGLAGPDKAVIEKCVLAFYVGWVARKLRDEEVALAQVEGRLH